MKKNFYLFLVMLFAGVTSMFAQKIYIEDFAIQAGETQTLDIILESDAFENKAVQADFVLPEGLSVVPNESKKPVTILADCSMPNSNIRANGNIAMALVGANVEAGSKVIANMTVAAAEDFEGGVITVTNQKIAGTKVADVTVNAELAVPTIEVYPSLLAGEDEIALNNHSNVSVESAEAIKVQFENGAGIKLAMYQICEAIEEDGELTYGDEIASDVLSLSTIGYAEFENILFEQGKRYYVRIMAWDNENPTSTPVATYECLINGSYVAPLLVYPSFIGDDDVELNSHSAVSVNMASSLKVEFENGANVIGITYLINEMNMGQDEDGTFWTVGKEIAAGEANLNTVAIAELEETLYFLQGKKYQLTVTAFENPADPTEIGIYTYEFNGSYVEPIVANIEISAAGYATYYAPFTVDLNMTRTDIEAYIVTGIDEDNKIVMEKIEDGVIPAFQPVVLKGSACVLPMSGEEEDYIEPEGILEGVDEEGLATIGNYVLQNQNGVVGFYQVTEELQPTVKAYRATLVVPNDKAKVKAFTFGGVATSINAVAASNNATTFDLLGRKVANAQKGIFIVNGKKVIK